MKLEIFFKASDLYIQLLVSVHIEQSVYPFGMGDGCRMEGM
jgi:hypothetical protein